MSTGRGKGGLRGEILYALYGRMSAFTGVLSLLETPSCLCTHFQPQPLPFGSYRVPTFFLLRKMSFR
jgi:hypothetical protein